MNKSNKKPYIKIVGLAALVGTAGIEIGCDPCDNPFSGTTCNPPIPDYEEDAGVDDIDGGIEDDSDDEPMDDSEDN